MELVSIIILENPSIIVIDKQPFLELTVNTAVQQV